MEEDGKEVTVQCGSSRGVGKKYQHKTLAPSICFCCCCLLGELMYLLFLADISGRKRLPQTKW